MCLKWIYLFFWVHLYQTVIVYSFTPAFLPQLVKDYFNMKSVSVIHLIMCSDEDTEFLTRELLYHQLVKKTGISVSTHSNKSTTEWLYPMNHHSGIFLDMNCKNQTDFINDLSTDMTIFNGSYAWLCWSELNESVNYFNAIPLYLDSDIAIAFPSTVRGDDEVSLLNVYKACPERPLSVTTFGIWKKYCGITNFKTSNKKTDFEGMTLFVSMALKDLSVDLNSLNEQIMDTTYKPGLDMSSRYFYVLSDILRIMCNFKWNVLLSPSMGDLQESGKFSGTIGLVQNGSAHLTIEPMLPKEEFRPLLDFLIPFQHLRSCFIFRQPKALKSLKALIRPFKMDVWLYVGSMMVLTTLTYSIICKFKCFDNIKNEGSISMGLFLVIGIISQQGIVVEQRRWCGKFFSAVSLYFGFMIVAYYNAAIMKFLLLPSFNSIQTLDHLLRSPFELSMLDAPDLASQMIKKNSLKSEDYEKIMDQNKRGVKDSLVEEIENVRTYRTALHGEDTLLYYHIQQTFRDSELCDLAEIELLKPRPLSVSIKKGSPFKEFMNRNILLMKERGIFSREHNIWYTQRPECMGSLSTSYMDLETLTIAFWILYAGFITSVALFIGELFSGLLLKKVRIHLQPNNNNTQIIMLM